MSNMLNQNQISSANIMVVGCGALGNEVLKNLVLMGVTHITAVDFDIVETGNLSRSILFTKADAEQRRLKVDVVAERLKQLNPDIDMTTICGDIAYNVGLGLIKQMDVIIGCVDSRWARFCINRLAMRAGKPWVDGGIDGLEGTARVFMPGKNCYACNLGPEGLKDLARRMPCSGIIRRQEQAGSAPTTSIVASVIGAIQVQEALKLIQPEFGTSLCGRMFYYEGQHMEVHTAQYEAYDDDCAEHECWHPISHTKADVDTCVQQALHIWEQELGADEVELCLANDCFVYYVSRRDNDERTMVMCPGHKVEEMVEHNNTLCGLSSAALYQNEYKHITAAFPYPDLTLQQLGIPSNDVVHVVANGKDYYLALSK